MVALSSQKGVMYSKSNHSVSDPTTSFHLPGQAVKIQNMTHWDHGGNERYKMKVEEVEEAKEIENMRKSHVEEERVLINVP